MRLSEIFLRGTCLAVDVSIAPMAPAPGSQFDQMTPRPALDAVTYPLPYLLGKTTLLGTAWANRIYEFADVLDQREFIPVCRRLISQIKSPAELVIDSRDRPTGVFESADWINTWDFYHLMSYFNTMSYLPDDLLVKFDRASMAVGLEARDPLLDRRIVEFAARIPTRSKVRNGVGKWLLRQVLTRYVPESLIDRPKKGFGIPIEIWLRGPMKSWAKSLIDERKLTSEGCQDQP